MRMQPPGILGLPAPPRRRRPNKAEALHVNGVSEAAGQLTGHGNDEKSAQEVRDHILNVQPAGPPDSGNCAAMDLENRETLMHGEPAATNRAEPHSFIPPRGRTPTAPATSPVRRAPAPVLRQHLTIRNFEELERRCLELGATDYLVEGVIPARSIGIVVGDSGLGKSPLLYQLGICVAAGVPFLGHAVRQGPTLYLDYENGLGDSHEMVKRISGHLGLDAPPTGFNMWHFNDCSPSYDTEGYTAIDMIGSIRPALVIIDSLSAYRPEAEEKNSWATHVFQELRRATRDYGATVLTVHHLRKPSTKSGEAPPPLDEGDVRTWFLQTRGARNLINTTDVRLGVDVPGVSGGIQNSQAEGGDQIALTLRGFGRVRGEIGPIYVARSFDEEGEPVGYRRMIGVELLFNDLQQQAFSRLPPNFSFGDAKRIYGRQDQATTDFLQKCQRLGLLKKVRRGHYEKCGAPE